MNDTQSGLYDLDKVLAEMVEDQTVDRGAKRLLTQEDIRRLVEESRRRREAEKHAAGKATS